MSTTLNGKALGQLVIRPVLHYLGVTDGGAANLLLGTALSESEHARRREAHGELGGIGLYGITPSMHRAAWDRYLAFDPELASRVRNLASLDEFLRDPDRELATNLAYASAIAMTVYLACGKPIPAADDSDALGRFWWRHFHARATGSQRYRARQWFLPGRLAA